MKIFAHRGASRESPENSPEAFRKALELGADGIEIDVRMTRDGVPVVAHDPEAIHLRTFAEVKGSGIAALADILTLAAPATAEVILDIKAQKGWMEAAPRAIAELALKNVPADRLLFSSFYWRHLWTLKRFFPNVRRGLILKSKWFSLVPPWIFDRSFGIRSLHPGLWWITESRVLGWQRKGLRVFPWVANTREEIEKCLAWKVDGIFTDDPRLALKIRDQHGG